MRKLVVNKSLFIWVIANSLILFVTLLLKRIDNQHVIVKHNISQVSMFTAG